MEGKSKAKYYTIFEPSMKNLIKPQLRLYFPCPILDLLCGDNTESLLIMYLFPRHATVLEKSGINQIIPIMRSLIGERR